MQGLYFFVQCVNVEHLEWSFSESVQRENMHQVYTLTSM